MNPQIVDPPTRSHRHRSRMAVTVTIAAVLCAAVPAMVVAASGHDHFGKASQRIERLAHRSRSMMHLAEMLPSLTRTHTAHGAHVSKLPASGMSLCVATHGPCFTTIQAALDAAHDGDTIHVGHGTFAGGFTITKSVRLVGAGARATVIKGGGSVITIGEFGAAVEPTVTITGVTITGGFAHSSPESEPFTGEDGVFALGGGVEIPPNADFSGGADVTITNSVIAGNRVAPSHTIPSGLATCPGGSCPFALAAGGGIDSWGTLKLVDSSVSHNQIGAALGPFSIASDANAGGIQSWQGALTLVRTSVDGNIVLAAGPNGRYADAGGVFVEGGSLTMDGSSISGNAATLAASLPDDVDMAAIAGGIHIAYGVPATIRNSRFNGNSITMTNSVGYGNAWSGGLHTDSDVTATGVVVSNNMVTASGHTYSVGDSGAGEMGGSFTRAIMRDNRVTISSATDWAFALAGASIFRGSLTGSVIAGNHVNASGPNGGAWVVGGGLVADYGGISLDRSTVTGNSARGSGPEGSVQGGGIFDAAVPDGPPGGPLSLTRSSVTGNVISGSPAITLEGGGIFTENVVTMTNSVVARNQPDQCVGC